MRHSAWLNAVPERAKNDKSEEPQLSRLEQIRKSDEHYQPDMPPVDCEYLIGYLFEVGPTMAAGMDVGPVTHTEIRSWQNNTGVELQPWEVRFIRSLSFEYIAENRRARKRDCPPPWREEGAPDDRVVIAKSMQESVRRLARM